MLQCRLFQHVVLDILHGLPYEILGIRPLLIDELSSILIQKTGSYCPVRIQLTSWSSSVLQRGSTITAFARALARAFAGALELFLATEESRVFAPGAVHGSLKGGIRMDRQVSI
jgi:hypothetical protein